MSDLYVSWYFDLSSTSILYGATVWNDSKNKRMELLSTTAGKVSKFELIALISGYSSALEIDTGKHTILFDDSPEMTTITESLKRVMNTHKRVHLVKREGLITEQILRYSSMINRFYIPDSFLVAPDLIFDDYSLTNLIDPVCSDEQTIYPLTQSLAIACQHTEIRDRRSLDWLKSP